MQELSFFEIEQVSGAGGPSSAPSSAPAPAGTLTRPTRGESEKGREINDLAGMLGELGSWIGLTLYDVLHPVESQAK